MQFPIVPILLCLALGSAPASAYQQFLTYRIAGQDIQSITLAPHADENPAAMTLNLQSSGGSSDILIESDGGLDACKTELEYIIGSKDAYAEIVVDMNARTMNGVMVLQCATFYGLFGE
ncbi:hypothetical protein [Roseibium sp. Sym1]|uniref:hypothetical protein n=1 Tax=Roseibium sp. Sym1 TaxID=3016006 RepID=UPI0022B505E5|nr:hypothetical protein [Roseibium sp. Sym1]